MCSSQRRTQLSWCAVCSLIARSPASSPADPAIPQILPHIAPAWRGPYHRAIGQRPGGRREPVDKRRSIEVSGVKHLNPIPAASQKGPFVVSGAISGADPESGKVPPDLDAQCAAMFANVRRLIEAAGGTPD